MRQLPTVIESIGDQGQRVERGFIWPEPSDTVRTESGFRWPPEAVRFTPRPPPLEAIVDLLGTLSAAAMLLAVGFVVGAMWRAGL
jgi:hypothetical protein